MALSMDEQRVLAEIERRLAAEEPALASCMTSFRRPGPALMLKSPRARILGSLFTVALVAVISLMVYAMIPFRAHMARVSTGHTAPDQTSQTTATGTTSGRAATISAPPSMSAVVSADGKSKTGTRSNPAKSVNSGTSATH